LGPWISQTGIGTISRVEHRAFGGPSDAGVQRASSAGSQVEQPAPKTATLSGPWDSAVRIMLIVAGLGNLIAIDFSGKSTW
jgi:hypothetical protein